jgi:hypothetical protein
MRIPATMLRLVTAWLPGEMRWLTSLAGMLVEAHGAITVLRRSCPVPAETTMRKGKRQRTPSAADCRELFMKSTALSRYHTDPAVLLLTRWATSDPPWSMRRCVSKRDWCLPPGCGPASSTGTPSASGSRRPGSAAS